jgi:hypothetical protein
VPGGTRMLATRRLLATSTTSTCAEPRPRTDRGSNTATRVPSGESAAINALLSSSPWPAGFDLTPPGRITLHSWPSALHTRISRRLEVSLQGPSGPGGASGGLVSVGIVDAGSNALVSRSTAPQEKPCAPSAPARMHSVRRLPSSEEEKTSASAVVVGRQTAGGAGGGASAEDAGVAGEDAGEAAAGGGASAGGGREGGAQQASSDSRSARDIGHLTDGSWYLS